MEEKEKEGKRLVEEAKKAVKEDGVNTIVFGCGSMLRVEGKISKRLEVPVIVPGVAALKICEDLIDMNLSQSKRYFKSLSDGNKRI